MNETLYLNIDATLEFFYRSLATEVYDQNGVKAWHTGSNVNYDNVAYANTKHPDLDKNIAGVIEFFKGFAAPWTWIVNPFNKPSNLEEILKIHGLKLIGTAHTMVNTLENLNLGFPLQNYQIKEVTDLKGMTDWAICVNEAFKTGEGNMCYRDINMRIPYGGNHAFHHYVAYYNEEPVAAGTLSVNEHGARISNIGTRSAYFRKGFASAITLQIMREAKLLGYKFCCLDASSKGFPMYTKLGFKECYESKVFGL